ncbi:MAG TPA: hypothetical protein VJP77_00620 [Planctomycetota bacterium]|nr:hypothetical protein [Planctomycetota bacterium]
MAKTPKQEAREESARGCSLLRVGRFHEGWIAYEARHRLSGMADLPLDQPAWEGQPLEGRSILVLREQGVGDEIWLASCLPDLLRLGGRVALTCDSRLAKLFRRSFRGASILAEEGPRSDWRRWRHLKADYRVMLGDLGRYLRPTRESFPGTGAFLVAESSERAAWRARLAGLGPGLKVGLSWQGGANLRELRQPSWSLFEAPLRVPGTTWIDLQYGETGKLRGLIRERFGRELVHFDQLDLMNDFDSTAGLVAELDLIVSVPNTTVHLAGALGRPVWLVFDPAWGCCWVTRGEEVPWYPSVRVLALGRERSWSSLGERLAAELSVRLRTRPH